LELAGEMLMTQASSRLNRMNKCENGLFRSVAHKQLSGKLTILELVGKVLMTQASSRLNQTQQV